mgnify:CR=1 FL=1
MPLIKTISLAVFYFISSTVSVSAVSSPLMTISNYKNFFHETCSNITETEFFPNIVKGWSLESKDSNKAHFIHPKMQQEVKIVINNRNKNQKSSKYTFYKNSKPEFFISSRSQCIVNIARLIKRDTNGRIDSISTLSPDLLAVKLIEPLNPEVPSLKPKIGIRVALIDTGINYLLPEITKNIARKSPNVLFGFDFEDGDHRPFDIDFVGSPFFPRHHGTSVASILIKEAPNVQIVPYRFSRKNPCLFTKIIEDIAKLDIKVALMPMGSQNIKTWQCFYDTAQKNQEILFIVSAGNQNRNIDINHIYPASLPLKNMLVISSGTIFGDLAKGSNFGSENVDLIVNAEQISVIDHRGVKSTASGSSYAVPRIGAMIVRFLALNPEASIDRIKNVLKKRAIIYNKSPVRLGWIPDPLDDYLFKEN